MHENVERVNQKLAKTNNSIKVTYRLHVRIVMYENVERVNQKSAKTKIQ